MADVRRRDRRRGLRGEGVADRAPPVPRRVPGSHAVLRRARAPLRDREVRQRRAVRRAACAIETAAEPTWEAGAYENADFGARHQDKRQGWRGPEWRLDGAARATFLARQSALYGDAPLAPGKRYLALVDKVDAEHAEVLDRRAPPAAAAAQHAVGVEVAARQRRERLRDRQMRRARSSPATSCGSRARSARSRSTATGACPIARTRRGSCATTRSELGRRAPRRRQARAGAAPADGDLHGRSPHRLRRRDGRRLRLRPLGVQPRRAGVPAAGLDVQADLLRARRSSRATASTPCSTTSRSTITDDAGETRGRRRTSTAAIEQRRRRSSTRSCSRRTSRRSSCSPRLRRPRQGRHRGVDARRLGFTDEAVRRRRARARRVVQQARRDGARVHRVRAPRRVVAAPAGQEKDWVYVRRILDRAGNTIEDNTVAEDPQLRGRRSLRSRRRARRRRRRRRRSRRAPRS